MKTKICFFFFILLSFPTLVRAQFNFSYNTGNDTATVIGYTGPGGAVTIPSTVTSGSTVYSVTGIGTEAFTYDTTITSVTIPGSVTSIGDEAFEGCDGLITITIPDSVTNIGDNVFNECSGMTNFTVAADNPAYSSTNGALFDKDQTTLIQYPAGSSNSSYTIPASVTNLGLNSFEGSPGLKSIMIPNNVQNIGVGAFSNCPGLTNAIIGTGVTNLSDYVFYDCTGLTNFIFLGNAPLLGGSHAFELLPAAATIYYLPGTIGWSSTYGGLPAVPLTAVNGFEFTLTNGVITITGYTGPGGNVTIPNVILGCPVTAIGTTAFINNSTLISATIPDTVTNIGEAPFAECGSLTNIAVVANNPAYTSVNGVLFNKNQTLLVEFPGGDGGNYAIPNSVTNIGVAAFGLCSNLTSVTIVNSVTIVSLGAFEGCFGLTNVIVGSGVTSIGDQSFAVCTNLTSITFLGNAPVLGGTNVFVTGSLSAYDPATVYYLPGTIGWSSMYGGLPTVLLTAVNGFEFTLNNGVITITGYTGSGDDATIPDSIFGFPVTTISVGAFANDTDLTSIVIPNSVTNIGVEAFYNCASLTSVTLPDDLTSIGVEAFYNCASLASITVPASVTSIGAGAFDNCLSLESITFLGNAPMVGNAVFASDFATVYYYSGTTGWGSTYGGLPTLELAGSAAPQIRSASVQSGDFSFAITGATNQTIVVMASTNLINWQPIWTNTLSGTDVVFADLRWTNYPARFYRVR